MDNFNSAKREDIAISQPQRKRAFVPVADITRLIVETNAIDFFTGTKLTLIAGAAGNGCNYSRPRAGSKSRKREIRKWATLVKRDRSVFLRLPWHFERESIVSLKALLLCKSFYTEGVYIEGRLIPAAAAEQLQVLAISSLDSHCIYGYTCPTDLVKILYFLQRRLIIHSDATLLMLYLFIYNALFTKPMRRI